MLTLQEVKLHCRIDSNDEDTLLDSLIETARLSVANYLNIDEAQMTSTVPSPIRHAAMLMVGTLYENRESQTERPLHKNSVFEALLNPYRVMA